VSEPKFKVGEYVRPTIRGLTHNIMVIVKVSESLHSSGFYTYTVLEPTTENIWSFREGVLEYPNPLELLAWL
jgi:hypothetical protein